MWPPSRSCVCDAQHTKQDANCIPNDGCFVFEDVRGRVAERLLSGLQSAAEACPAPKCPPETFVSASPRASLDIARIAMRWWGYCIPTASATDSAKPRRSVRLALSEATFQPPFELRTRLSPRRITALKDS